LTIKQKILIGVAYFVYILSVFMIKPHHWFHYMVFGTGAQQDGLYPGPKMWCYAPEFITKVFWKASEKGPVKMTSPKSLNYFFMNPLCVQG